MERRESTTLLQLKQEVDRLLETRPELSNARVLIDTEAREFHAHMIDITSIYAEDQEGFEGMGMKWVTVTPDYSMATSNPDFDESDFERIFKLTSYGFCIREQPEDLKHTESYDFLKTFSLAIHKATAASLPKRVEETCI